VNSPLSADCDKASEKANAPTESMNATTSNNAALSGTQEEASVRQMPTMLLCPECGELMKNATELPCCKTCFCRPCVYKKIMLSKKKCWLNKSAECQDIIQLSQLSPAVEMRELIEDYLDGGTLYADKNGKEAEDREEIPDFIDCMDVTIAHKPIVVVKTEAVSQEEEEYSELGNSALHLSQIKTEHGVNNTLLPATVTGLNFDLAPTKGLGGQGRLLPQLTDLQAAELEFAKLTPQSEEEAGSHDLDLSQLSFGESMKPLIPKQEGPGDWGNNTSGGGELKCDALKKEMDSIMEEDDLLLPHPYTLPNTPSSVRTEHQSSGYWSDDSFEGPFFGKLHWVPEDLSQGYIECWDGGEKKKAYVARVEVKCGAETGDLVEFTLKTDPEHGKVAKRVKLVEKALPVSDADQIRSQANMKRSLELSAGIFNGGKQEEGPNKRIKTENVIDAEIELQSMASSYLDIAAEEEPPFFWHQAQIKPESLDLGDCLPSSECTCNSPTLNRCRACPIFFLRSESQHIILERESVTLVARIEGNANQDLNHVRHLHFPSQFPLNSVDFSLLSTLGNECIVEKVSPVFQGCYVFVSVVNDTEYEVNISPGNILGICQSHTTESSAISEHFIMEPPDKQHVGVIPITVNRKDFSRVEPNHLCGLAEIGEQHMNYVYCLVKIDLLPEYAKKFDLLKDELTVQVKRNIWLELIPRGKGLGGNILPKNGVIGHAVSIMNGHYIDQMFRAVSPPCSSGVSDSDTKSEATVEDDDDPYASMMMKIDNDISSITPGDNLKTKFNLLDKTFRGVITESLTILPDSERTVNLFLYSDDDYDPKNLLKMQVEITNNEEFKYYNNCYNIELQVSTVMNDTCKASDISGPCVKAVIKNQRSEVAVLPVNSSVALIRVYKITAKEVNKVPQDLDALGTEKLKRGFSAEEVLKKMEVKLLQSWEVITSEDTYNKSLAVEEKFPYYTLNPKPKSPFRLNLPNLLIRVGKNQESRPVRVFDRVSGVFTCTICDTLVLDKYSIQDHIYSDKHKKRMKQVQVIAGLKERLDMNRPVIQEMLDQVVEHPILGLDHTFEVLQSTGPPVYHCALCNTDLNLKNFMAHIVNTSHTFMFLKEHFPSIWSKVLPIQNVSKWSEHDLQCYYSMVDKISTLYGQRKPSIVSSSDKLEEILDKLPTNQYSTNRSEFESFCQDLISNEPLELLNLPLKPKPKLESLSHVAVTLNVTSIAPGSTERVICKVTNVPSGHSFDSKFVLVTKSPYGGYEVKHGFSRVFLRDQSPCVYVNVMNNNVGHLKLEKNSKLAMLKWKK